MKKITRTLFSKIGLAVIGLFILTFSGCVKQRSVKGENIRDR